jgi:hypothetical protein
MSQGIILLSGTFSGTGQSASAQVFGPFNIAIWGTPLSGGLSGAFSATIALERSLDGGTTWIAAAADGTGTAASYTSAVSLSGTEPEQGNLYRFDCTVYASGTVNYRLSQIGNVSSAYVRMV